RSSVKVLMTRCAYSWSAGVISPFAFPVAPLEEEVRQSVAIGLMSPASDSQMMREKKWTAFVAHFAAWMPTALKGIATESTARAFQKAMTSMTLEHHAPWARTKGVARGCASN